MVDRTVTLWNMLGVAVFNLVGELIMTLNIKPLNKRIQQQNCARDQLNHMDTAPKVHHQQTQQQIQYRGDDLGKLYDIQFLVGCHQNPMGHATIVAE